MLETEIKKLREAIEANTAALVGLSKGEPEKETPKAKKKVEPKVTPVVTDGEVPTPQPKTEPVADDAPDFEEIKDLVLGLSRSGKKDAVRAKLDEYGARKLTELNAENLAAVGEWARAQ